MRGFIDKDTKAARKAAEAVLRAKIEKEQSAKNESNITLKELYTLFINNQKESCKESTWIRDKVVLGTAIRIMGEDVIARKLNVRFIDQQLRKTGKANVSLNSYLKLLKRMLRWAYRMDYIKDIAYLDKIPAYPDPEKKLRIEDKYLSADELKTLLQGMAVKRWALLTEFLALSGLRIGEAMALTNDDIDEYIHVTKTMNLSTKKVLNSPKTDAGYRDVYTARAGGCDQADQGFCKRI